MKALVVGLGRMGMFHRRVLHDIGFDVTAVDPDPATGAQFRSIADASRRRTVRYDVAAIACPTEHLVRSAVQLAGTPMLVEKPCATNEYEAAFLGAYLRAQATPVCVGFVERFNPRVRELRDRVAAGPHSVHSARFVRYSDRSSDDLALDLLTHDVDLARHLGIELAPLCGEIEFDVRADEPHKVRRIELEVSGPSETRTPTRRTVHADLMDHDESPLHALWHAFLSGRAVPTPADAAVAIHEAFKRLPQTHAAPS